jgi:hypothetical protein
MLFEMASEFLFLAAVPLHIFGGFCLRPLQQIQSVVVVLI